MEKVFHFHFDSVIGPYRSDAVAVYCFDDRFKLHDTGRVILIAHSDCGACGGLARFNHDAIAEAEHHRSELARAAACVRSAIPEVEVECFFADFFGVWRVETARSAGSD
jgi:hypothetical protein